MGLKKGEEKEYAKRLFVDGDTQKEIAERVGVAEKTISKWAKDGRWSELKRSMITMKSNQLTFLYRQLDVLGQTIESRDGFATPSEVDMISKLTASIQRLEVEASLGETIEVMTKFIDFMRSQNLILAKEITEYSDAYIQKLLK